MRRRLCVGNWKMHGTLASNRALLEALKAALKPSDGVDYAVCPPFPYLAQAAELLKGAPVALGAQNVSEHDGGAYTGEVAGPMLREFGCRYAIVGHSERRTLYGESDAQVAAKMQAALRHGLTPIVCIGESLEQRDRGDTERVLERQVKAVLAAGGADALSRAVVAYEPIWAIGTGRTATPEQAQHAHRFVRAQVAAENGTVAQGLRVLYGGSVKGSNAADLFAMPDVDGGLVGGASLLAADFVAICQAAAARAAA
jgi:triosephosphate isomerase (TIM)